MADLSAPPRSQDFELDLLGVKPGAQVPALLGKILNTLANDRNCKCVCGAGITSLSPCEGTDTRSPCLERAPPSRFASAQFVELVRATVRPLSLSHLVGAAAAICTY